MIISDTYAIFWLAEFWADDQIDDNTFVGGIQWLISNGIMKLS